MSKPRAAALPIALALLVAGCSAPQAQPSPAPSVTATVAVAGTPTAAAVPTTAAVPEPSVTATAGLSVAKDVLDALSAKCAGGKVAGTATEVYDTCYCVGTLITSGGAMAGQMPDGRPVVDTCPALIAKAQG